MKKGISIWSFAGATLEENMKLAKDAGFEGIEVALDEVGEETEIEAIRLAVNSGVRFIVTVHAADYNELLHRPQIKRLIETYSFSKVVMLKKEPVGEVAQIYDTKELRDEIIRCSHNLDIFDPAELKSVVNA